MPFKAGINLVQPGCGGSAAIVPLSIAEVQGRFATATVSNVSHNSLVFRWPHVIPFDQSVIVLSFNGWYLNSSGLTESNLGNAFTLQSVSLTAPNGTVVPVTFGGLRTKAISAGDVDIQSDPIAISAFGYSSLPANGTWWSKGVASVASNGQAFPSSDAVYTADVANSQCATYDSAATTPSSTDIDGVYTATGTAFSNVSHGLRPIILGRRKVAGINFFAIGSSTGEEVGDDGSNGLGGRGSVQRGMYNRGTNPLPCLNACRGSNRYQTYVNGTRWRSYMKYAQVLVDQMGGPNVSAGTALATIQSENASLWADFRAQGYTKIYKTLLTTRTTSSDGWATLVNQSHVANFGPSQLCDQVNAWLLTKESDSTIDGIIHWDDAVDPSAPNKWKPSSCSLGLIVSSDGVHANATGHGLFGAWIRTTIEPLVLPFSLLNYAPRFIYDTRDETSLLDANGAAPSAGGFTGAVATVQDKSGNARHATHSTPARQPAFPRAFGGTVRGLDFNGTTNCLVMPDACLIYSDYTFISIYLPDTTTLTTGIVRNQGVGGSQSRCYTNNQGCDFGGTTLNLPSPTSGNPLLHFSRVNGTGATKQLLKVGTVAEQIGAVTHSSVAANTTLGAYGDQTSGFFDGVIVLVVGIGARLYAPEVNRIAAALVADFAARGATVPWSDIAT